MMWPAVLGMTYDVLPEEKAGLAGGLIIGVAGFGNAAGPLIGGFLTDALSWRWVMFLNLPIAAIAVLRHLARDPAVGHRRRARAHRLPGGREHQRRADRPARGARPGDRVGLERPAHPRAVRALRPAARGVRGDRAPGRALGADPARRDGQPALPRRLHRDAVHVRRRSSPRCCSCRSSSRRSSATRRSRPGPGCCR